MGATIHMTPRRRDDAHDGSAKGSDVRALATSLQDVLSRLQSLLVEPGCRLGREMPPPLRRVAARVAEGDQDRLRLLGVRDVVYVFKGHAVAARVIQAPWVTTLRLQLERVYVRTREGVFVTGFRSLAEIRQRLPQSFIGLHQSVLVNVDWIEAMDSSAPRVCLVGVRTNGTTEWLGLSRRAVGPLRDALGLTRRPRRGARGSRCPAGA